MPQMPATERSRQIVEAAARVIARVGMERATTRLIAAEAGVSLSTLHYAFKDKSAVLAGVYRYLVERDAAMLKTAIVDGCGLESGVRILTLDFLEHMLRDESMMMANYEISFWSARTPNCAHLVSEAYVAYQELFIAALQRAAGRALSDGKARPLVQFLMNAIDGVVIQYIAQRDPVAARNSLELMASIAMREFGSGN